MKKLVYFAAPFVVFALIAAAYSHFRSKNYAVLTIDMCVNSASAVSVAVDNRFTLPVERAALYLEMLQSDGTKIYSLFGPIELEDASGFVFDVPTEVCTQTVSIQTSIEYELPIAAQFDQNAQGELVTNTTVRAVPDSVNLRPVELFRI